MSICISSPVGLAYEPINTRTVLETSCLLRLNHVLLLIVISQHKFTEGKSYSHRHRKTVSSL